MGNKSPSTTIKNPGNVHVMPPHSPHLNHNLPYSYEEYCNSKQFIFYRKSNLNSKGDCQSEIWEPYDQNTQIHLKQGYLNFLQDSSQQSVPLLPPLNNYIAHFGIMQELSLLDFIYVPIKIEKIENNAYKKIPINDKPISEQINLEKKSQSEKKYQTLIQEEEDQEEFKFYWNSNPNPFDKMQIALWDEYDHENQNFINQKYKIFCKDNSKFSFPLILQSKNYGINFLKMQQYSLLDINKIRPIKIEKLKDSSSDISLKNQISHKLNLISLTDDKSKSIESGEEEIFEFFWNSKPNPFNDSYPEIWNPYTENNQAYLNIKYKEFRKDKKNATFDLIPPENNYAVNFLKMIQYSLSEINEITAIKIEKIHFRFFWKSNENPWNKNQEPLWTPYDLEDEYIIKKAYQDFLDDKNKKYVELKISENYYIDFSQMLQISKNNSQKQRPIQRCNPRLVTNIVRINRFETTHFSLQPNNKINFDVIEEIKIDTQWQCLSLFDNLNQEQYKNISKIYFNIFPEFPCEIDIGEGLCFFKNYLKIDVTLEEMKHILIQEISDLSANDFLIANKNHLETLPAEMKHLLSKEIPNLCKGNSLYSKEIYKSSLQEITDYKSFFKKIIYIYTLEGFLYKNVNYFLRKNNKRGFEIIKYYYTCLLASFYYFSNKTYLNKEIYQNKELLVYRGSEFTDEEFQQYKIKNMKNIIRIFKEFLSTSLLKEIPLPFFDKDDSSKKQFYWEIKVPYSMIEKEPFNFADISEASVFPGEKEVLLRSGAIIEIEEIVPYTEIVNNEIKIYPNKFKKICSLKSFSLSSFFKIITLNPSITQLYLDNNNLGGNEKNMLFLKEALKNNISISGLFLGNNNLGANEKNMMYLKEALQNNTSITSLWLGTNYLGGNVKSLIYLKEALIINNSITTLSIENNDLGCDEKNMMHLKEAFEKNKTITTLGLGNNNLGQNEMNMKFLKQALENNISITTLWVGNNNFGRVENNIIYLKEALEKNTTISQIGLGNNNIGSNEINMIYMKEALEKNNSISVLWLGNNNLGVNVKNMMMLKEALTKNNKISQLHLGNNNLGTNEKNMMFLKKLLQRNNSLKGLYLENNNFGANKNNIIILKEAFQTNNSISTLWLANNNLEEKDKNLLRDLNKQIKINF